MTVRRGGIVLPSLAAGVLLALSLPPFGAWPSAFVGAALLYWRLGALRLSTRLLAGWVAGIGCFGIGLFWAQSFNWYGAVVLVLVESVTTAVAAGATPPRRGRALAFVGAATLMEAVRMSWPFGGLPVGGVFLGQSGGPLLGSARLGGPLLLTAVVWAGGVALGELGDLTVRWRRERRMGGRPWAGLVALVLVVLAAVLGEVAPDGGPAVRTLSVASVQGGGRRGFNQFEVGQAGVFSAELDASTALEGSTLAPALVVWPEDVVALVRPLAGSRQAARLAALALDLHATVLAGVTVTEPHATFRNEIVAWGPSGRIVSVFEKVHRVPFGEYVPFRGLFSHLADLAAVPLDAIAGHGTGLMTTPAGPLGVLVSYEVFFAARGRSSVRAGAQLLVVPTNTSSYSSEQMPSQEVAADRVQAVEEGRDLVQAAPTGYSTFVTNRGVVRRRSALSTRQVLVGAVPLRRGATLYERFGDLPVMALAALALLAGWAAGMGLRRPAR
ncbi:MAG TPA: apolipoprotein N-acyltransferase [Acidimicrobiales bacterium]|nr:apolipoprotein N-acyltransferase [Acidimicrobiales bacterium]